MSNSISNLKNKKKRQFRWLTALILAVGIFSVASLVIKYQVGQDDLQDKSISQLNKDLADANVKSIKIVPDYLFQRFEVEPKSGSRYVTTGPHMESKEAKDLAAAGVAVAYKKPDVDLRALPSYLMLLALLVFAFISIGQSLGLTTIRAAKMSDKLFKDVAGNEEAKAAMVQVVSYLKDPTIYEAIGAKFPKGIIMDGPPGTGKTLLAKAIAGEAGANFLAVSGSAFSSMFVGMSGLKVRGMFARARRCAPCVLFIDEIDAIGGHRLSEGTAVAREMGSTLNSLLVQMDGFDPNSGVVVIAATNRIELLDPALLRSGRFDRHVHVQLPTLAEREAILQLHSKDFKLGTFDCAAVARSCIGMSGADLANVINQAALLAVGEGAKGVETRHGIQGRDRVMMGDPRLDQARGMSQETKLLLAVHEVGHAMVGMVYGKDKVSRISIIPRGRSLGQTLLNPSEDALVQHQDDLMNRIRLLLGGRAAELTVNATQTTGASDDLMRASRLALDFVGRYGMGRKSLLYIDDKSSDSMKRYVEDEANELLEHCLSDAINTIRTNRELFDEIVGQLLEEEEIDEEGVEVFLRRGPKQPSHPKQAQDLANEAIALASAASPA